MIRKIIAFLVLTVLIIACSKNALTGKKQLTLLPETELQSMASTQYMQFLSSNKVVSTSNNRDAEMVKRVGDRIVKSVENFYADKGMADKLAGFK
ncbi:MAG: M48 family peptidase, partial [Chitinophagaceae bacterium]